MISILGEAKSSNPYSESGFTIICCSLSPLQTLVLSWGQGLLIQILKVTIATGLLGDGLPLCVLCNPLGHYTDKMAAATCSVKLENIEGNFSLRAVLSGIGHFGLREISNVSDARISHLHI